MPADASGRNLSAQAESVLGDPTRPPIALLVEVQVAEALDVALPPLAEFERWAQHAFSAAAARHWDAAWRDRVGATAGAQTPIDCSELCIRLVDAAESETLNATWRDKHAPTNVLSFTAEIVAGQYAPLGDLVLCWPVIEREALEQGKAVPDHCAHLVVHGMLHLLGFDHLIDSEAEAMEAMEATVLNELGIGDPYE